MQMTNFFLYFYAAQILKSLQTFGQMHQCFEKVEKLKIKHFCPKIAKIDCFQTLFHYHKTGCEYFN